MDSYRNQRPPYRPEMNGARTERLENHISNNVPNSEKRELEDLPKFCRLALIATNVLAFLKSTEITFAGAVLLVLDPAFTPIFEDIKVRSNDLADEVTGPEIARLTGRFLLIIGPIMFVVGITGLTGAYRKSMGWLMLYLALLVVQVTVIIALCGTSIPKPLIDPGEEWRPLSDLLLAVVVIALAVHALMIFFTIALCVGVSRAENQAQVHPAASDNSRFDKATEIPKSDRAPNPVRRRSRYDY